jgi:outer membrane cobalamin receptor
LKKILSKYIPAQLGRIFNFRIFLFLTVFMPVFLFSGSRVTGVVKNSSGDPVPDVNISVAGTPYGSVSDAGGKYSLPRLPDGEHKIIFKHICCVSEESVISSGTEDVVYLDIVMKSRTLELDPIYAEALKEEDPDITITKREIENSASNTAEDALRKVPGINIDNIDGTKSRVSVRGTDTKHTSVYLDGSLVNSPLDGSYDLNTIPSEIIEKIEVYRSGDTAISSRAPGGIISITTKKKPEKNEVFFTYNNSIYLSDRDRFSYEKLNNHEYGAGVRYNLSGSGGIMLSFTGKRLENEWSYINASKFDEHRYIDNPNTPRIQTNSYSYSDNIYASYNYDSDRAEGRIGLNLSKYKYGIPGWYDQPFYEAYSERRDLLLTGYFLHNLNNYEYRFDCSAGYRNDLTMIEEISPLYYVDSDNSFKNLSAKLQVKYSTDHVILRSGAEYFKESVRSDDITGSEHNRDIISGYLKAEFKRNISNNFSFRTAAGLRKDEISGTDLNRALVSASLAPEFRKNNFSIIPSYSYDQSYSLPSFSDLFWAENLFSSGNVSLKPEYCRQHEASVSAVQKTGIFRFSSSYTYYHKDLEDLIVWIKRNNGKYTPENFKKGIITGHEISFRADQGENFGIQADYQIMDARQFTDSPVTNDKYIIYKPVETLSISLSGNYKEWHAELRSKYNGRMYLNESNSIDTYPYTLYGANISRKVKLRNSEIIFNIAAENLTDEQYQVIYGYPMPGRKIETGIKIKF